ncbi:extracellular solute-binding protein [Pseudokineococcus marinus]|uniref:Extracellular solute-binding protein n=1 Tax=Pseudokineococcus marinus TaxID=351215 RepID=A0A849BVE0_9ACTN|nr:extracellular solute-binding protein [Pseudokineococcus marinus]NNH21528.1 extracellular solute-binding protein [Pseudokineococcus marinus]
MRPRTRRATVAATAALVLGAGFTACGSSGPSADDPVELSYWSWAPNVEQVVETWNAEHPEIQVTVTDAGGNTDTATKLVTQTRAGNAPDMAQVEYPTLPSLVVGEVAADITEHVDDATRDAFTDSTWALTTFNDAVYGIPQDVGPMMMLYRADRFEELGVEVPTTWEEYAAAAAQVRAADPTSYIGTFSVDQTGFFAGMAQQAGAQWWSVDGDAWSVGIDDEASLAVADYWQGLVDEDAVLQAPILTPEWNAQVADGEILTWPSAVWSPGVIEDVAPETAGEWAMAPLPQWTEGDSAVGLQGGSSSIVTTSSDHPEEAAQFLAWLNGSDEGATALLTTVNNYPAATAGQEAATSNEPPALVAGQEDFYDLAAEVAADTIPVTWGPNYNVTNAAFADALGAAVQGGGSYREALEQVQATTVADMEETGYTVTR